MKRLENLILAASSDVPAKAELSLCQLLTEAKSICLLCFVLQSLTLYFVVHTVCGLHRLEEENLLNKSLNSSIGILTIS